MQQQNAYAEHTITICDCLLSLLKKIFQHAQLNVKKPEMLLFAHAVHAGKNCSNFQRMLSMRSKTI
jgi:hypothetical protein